MAILKCKGREKQMVDALDKGFLFNGEERVAYAEMCQAVMGMLWITGE